MYYVTKNMIVLLFISFLLHFLFIHLSTADGIADLSSSYYLSTLTSLLAIIHEYFSIALF